MSYTPIRLPEGGRWVTLDQMDRGMRMAAAKYGWIVEYQRPRLTGLFLGTVVSFPSGKGMTRMRIMRDTGTYYTLHTDNVLRIYTPKENDEAK